jgi:hypothetical protein
VDTLLDSRPDLIVTTNMMLYLLTLLLALFGTLATPAPYDHGNNIGGPNDDPNPFQVMKPNEKNALSWCDRRDRANQKCYTRKNAAGSKCWPFKDMKNANQMGAWPSIDLNCTVFAMDNCAFRPGGFAPLNGWGWDDYSCKEWADSTGVVGFTGQYKGKGPNSFFCWNKDKTYGIGKETNY